MGIDFIAGNEKRFFDFLGALGKEKIALVSHTDLDGIASAVIANIVLKADIIEFANYSDLNSRFIEKLKKAGAKKIVFTDLAPQNSEIIAEIAKFAEVLIIDHHPFQQDFNSEKVVFLSSQGYCAAYMCYELFSRVQNIENWAWLAGCASISDFCFKKNSEWLQGVVKKYDGRDVKSPEDCLNGKIGEIAFELSRALLFYDGDLKNVFDKIDSDYPAKRTFAEEADEVQKEIDFQKQRFYSERQEFRGRYYWEMREMRFQIKSYLINGLSGEESDKIYIFSALQGKYLNLSARMQNAEKNGQDMGEFLKKLIAGFEDAGAGGHRAAAGGYILPKDKEKFIERLKKL